MRQFHTETASREHGSSEWRTNIVTVGPSHPNALPVMCLNEGFVDVFVDSTIWIYMETTQNTNYMRLDILLDSILDRIRVCSSTRCLFVKTFI